MRRAIRTAARSGARLCAVAVLAATSACRGTSPGPALSDSDYWQLIEQLSEPPRPFDISENLVSNEPRLAENARWLAPSGGVFIGVGPEQNFTYIARLRPSTAFIVDIRRDNLLLHLVYKALFELSRDRVEFVSMLFARLPPGDLTSRASVEQLFASVERTAASPGLALQTVNRVHDQLITVHGFALSAADLESVDRMLKVFVTDGPSVQFWGSRAVDRGTLRPTYRQLMTMPDLTGQPRSYLASEESFQAVKRLHAHNRIIPVVGDLSGDGAMIKLFAYIRDHGSRVSGFYGSNVPVYLTNEQMRKFCRNLAILPAGRDVSYIDSDSVRPLAARIASCFSAASTR